MQVSNEIYEAVVTERENIVKRALWGIGVVITEGNAAEVGSEITVVVTPNGLENYFYKAINFLILNPDFQFDAVGNIRFEYESIA
jgi:hypothetical protein